MNKMQIKDYFSVGIDLASQNLLVLLVNYIIYIALCIAFGVTIVGILGIPGLTYGYTKMLIAVSRGEDVDFGEYMFAGFKDGNWLRALAFSLLSLIGVLLGLCLFVIPGVYLMLVWTFGFYVCVDHGFNARKSLAESQRLIRNLGLHKIVITWLVFSLLIPLTLNVVPIMGTIASFLLPPLTSMIYLALYNSTQDQTHE